MKFRSALLTVFLVTLPAWGAGVDREKEPRTPARQEPWLWTLEQRLDVRFDPQSIRERGAAVNERNRKVMADSGSDQRSIEAAFPTNPTNRPIENMIDGSRNPELLTPTEVFQGLLFAFHDDVRTRNDIRNRVGHELHTLGVSDEEFWDALEKIAGRYIDAFQFHSHGHPFTSSKQMDEYCAMRFDALEAARQRFGAPAFDRLMYVAVAPTMLEGGGPLVASPRGGDPRLQVQRQEDGCR